MAKDAPSTPASGEVMVPFERVVGLVRHLTHDIRNGLNTLDLQAALLQELVSDPEASPEVKRLRGMITSTAKSLQGFSSTFWRGEMHPVTYSAKIFAEDFRTRLSTVLPDQTPQIAWKETLGDESVTLDIELIFRAVSEFFKNAFHFREKGREIAARIFAEGGRFVFELREGKTALPSPPETWGREPLVGTRRGGFGMGLYCARRILEVHQGTVDFHFDPDAALLTTRLTLPLAAG
jgi:signal transduction histidine kinase